MRKTIFFLVVFLVLPGNIFATRGCCSSHGGVAGCNSSGRQTCKDGTVSPTCRCDGTTSTETKSTNSVTTKKEIQTNTSPVVNYTYGCMDKDAKNYNSSANRDDGSCKYYIMGCMDDNAKNYNPEAEKNNGKCEYYIVGCMDDNAKNYNEKAEKDDGSCIDFVKGCMDKNAINYNEKAEKDDGSCKYKEDDTNDSLKETVNSNEKNENNSTDSDDGSAAIGLMAIAGGVFGVKKIANKRKKNKND